MSQFDIKSRKPVVGKKSSIAVDVVAGQEYYFCTCGLSKNQPFCDGSHKETSFTPQVFKATETKKVYLCGCKQTGNAPFCDGSHKRIPEAVKVGDQWDAKKGDIKLYYFDLFGRGELSRLLLTAAGVAFDDVRFDVSQAPFLPEEVRKTYTGNSETKWEDFKPTTPYGQLPVLEFKGVQIAESQAIQRFIAKRFNLTGANDIEGAIIDSLTEQARDHVEGLSKARWTKDEEEKKAAFAKAFETSLKKFVAIEKLLAANNEGKGWLVGDNISYADIYFFYAITVSPDFQKAAEKPLPLLSALAGRVAEFPALKKYLADRPARFI